MNPQDSSIKEDVEVFQQYMTLLSSIPGINYIIDRNYRIVTYSKENWNTFAMENEGEDLLVEDRITGKSILEFFEGDRVRERYKSLYDAIFEQRHEEIKIAAKCDAPDVLRNNIIYLKPVYADPDAKNRVVGVLHQSLIISTIPREPVPLLNRQAKQPPKGRFLEICSICKFINYSVDGHEKWVPTEQYYQLGGTDPIILEQSICNDCSSMLNEFM